jgi:hypothetical protein
MGNLGLARPRLAGQQQRRPDRQGDINGVDQRCIRLIVACGLTMAAERCRQSALGQGLFTCYRLAITRIEKFETEIVHVPHGADFKTKPDGNCKLERLVIFWHNLTLLAFQTS